MNSIPRIPLGEWVDSFVASLYEHFEGLFRGFSYIIGGFVDLLTNFFNNNTCHIDDYYLVFLHLVHNEEIIFSHFYAYWIIIHFEY